MASRSSLRSLASAARRATLSSGQRLAPAALSQAARHVATAASASATPASSGTAAATWQSFMLPLAAAAAALAGGLGATAVAAELERTFIAIKPDGVQRGLISEIIARFERKGFKLVAIKLVQPSKQFAEQHYADLAGRPFFNTLTDFLSSGPVVAMVWEGPGVISYGRKMIGATNPQASEPGTIRGDFAVVVGRNIIHGSDGPETAKAEIGLWFAPEELIKYKKDSEKWLLE